MEVWYTELHEERELLEASPLDDLYSVPTPMITDSSVLVTVAEEQRGHLPAWGHRATPTSWRHIMSHYASRTKTRLPDWTRGRKRSFYRTLLYCRHAKVVLSEQQHRKSHFDRVATMRVYVTAAGKRAV
eukprot:3620310-Pyramimonas_sp.AAC.1